MPRPRAHRRSDGMHQQTRSYCLLNTQPASCRPSSTNGQTPARYSIVQLSDVYRTEPVTVSFYSRFDFSPPAPADIVSAPSCSPSSLSSRGGVRTPADNVTWRGGAILVTH